MSKSNLFETDLLKLILQNVTLANLGDGTGLVGSAAPGSLHIGLHTADPGEAGDQTTNEVGTGAYAGYTRVAVARTVGGWTVSGNTGSNAAAVTFPSCSGGTGATITHFSVGHAISGAGRLVYKGALTSPLAVSNGIQPSFAIGALTITED